MSAQIPSSESHRARHRGEALDDVDLRILAILRDDGRVSMSSLAEQVNVSRANAYARVERMRVEGIIEGFSARVNSAKLGLGITAIVFAKVRQPAREMLIGPLREIPGVEYCAFVTGEHDIVLVMRAPSVEALRDESMSRLYYEGSPVLSTNTVLVLTEAVRRPYVLP